MNTRDELARDMYIADNSAQSREQSLKDWAFFESNPEQGVPYTYSIADRLILAGWTKPRVVTTVEELDALEVESVVLCRRRAWTRFTPKQIRGAYVEIHKWMCPDGGIVRAESEQDIILPATVLWEPQS